MKKGKVHLVGDELFEKCEKRVIIHRDRYPPNPLKEYDQVFLLHSNIGDFSGNENDKDYPDPLVEIEDEDGFPTGEYKCRDGVVAFWVSAYIHSGIALSLGTVRCAFGDTPIPGGGGIGFDTTPNAAFMWTDKERFEKMCGPWMEVYDKETKTRRPAKDEQEFLKYLESIAEGELELFQKYLDGDCYWYETEVKRKFSKVYENGEKVEAHEWEDGGDSCGGYYVDNVGDIDFPKEDGWEVFADGDCSHLVGDEFTIPELVIRNPETGMYLLAEAWKEGDGSPVPALWTSDLSKAKVYHHLNAAYNADIEEGKKLWKLFDYDTVQSKGIIKDKDDLK